MTLALLDGDIIAYRAACGTETPAYFGDGVEVDIVGACLKAVKLAQEWADMVNAKEIIIAFTGPDKFRTRLLPTYKANRKGPKPAAHSDTVATLKVAFPHYLIPGLEADDVIGILMTTPKYADRAVMVSVDKDFKTIPGRLCNPSMLGGIITTTAAQADYWWMHQTLTGDSVDNYKGCPGIGPVKAPLFIGGNSKPAKLRTLWNGVVSAFKAAGLTEEDAITQARVARILRREDYDKDTKEIILWHPTTPIRIPVEAAPVDCGGPPSFPTAQPPSVRLSGVNP